MSGLDDLFLDGVRSGVPEIQRRFRRMLSDELRAEEDRNRRIELFLLRVPDSLRSHPTVMRIVAMVGNRVPTEHEWAEHRSELEALIEDEAEEDAWP